VEDRNRIRFPSADPEMVTPLESIINPTQRTGAESDDIPAHSPPSAISTA